MNEQTKKKYNRQRRMRQQKLARERQLRRMRLIASGIVVIIAFFIILALRGTFEKRAEVSTMTIDGSAITYEEVAPIGDYDFGELKDFVREEISQTEGVKLLQISKKGDVAYVRTGYDDIGVYSEFTGYEGFLGTVADAKRAGYDFDTAFSGVTDGALGETVKASAVKKEEDANVLIIRENGRFKVDGELLYVSTESMSIVDGSTVDISQGEGEDDATVLSYIVYK